jgi:DNA-binding transcriptional MerR regulator
MQIRLYLDEDAQRGSLVKALRERGVNVQTADEAGMRYRDDADHLDYATAQGRVLYSFNVGDFNRLHAEYVCQNKSHAGVILAAQRKFSVGEQLRRLLRIITAKSAEQMRDNVEFLGAWR